MKRLYVLMLLPLLASGCFRPSPGGLQGVWEYQRELESPATIFVETLTYTFNGTAMTRVLAQEFRLKSTGESVVLRTEDSGEIFVTDDAAFDYIDVSNITQSDYPTTVEFAVAGAITGYTAAQREFFYGEPLALTLQPKGAFRIADDVLTIKFGSPAAYPTDVDPPAAYELEKKFALFP